MEYIYVCAPDGGFEENYIKALNYCRYVKSQGKIPICAVTMNYGIYDRREPKEDSTAKNAGRELLKICSEVWIFGKHNNKTAEIISGTGKPIRYIEDKFCFNDRSEMLTVIFNEYQSKTGRLINRAIMEDIIFYLDSGLSDKLIIAAIKKAAKKSAGWEYAEGILKNCLSQGITTAEEMDRKETPKTVDKDGCDYGAFDLDLYEKMIRNS